MHLLMCNPTHPRLSNNGDKWGFAQVNPTSVEIFDSDPLLTQARQNVELKKYKYKNLDSTTDEELHKLVSKVDESGYFDETHVGSDEEDEDYSQEEEEEEEEEEVKEECEEGDESSPEEDDSDPQSTLQQMAQQVRMYHIAEFVVWVQQCVHTHTRTHMHIYTHA